MGIRQRRLFEDSPSPARGKRATRELLDELRAFDALGKRTVEVEILSASGRIAVPGFVNEFWTARQRAAHSLHEVSYRACFKPQLPRFFVERLTDPGDVVLDPFMGRGTTPIEAALLGRIPAACDVNPLSRILVEPRLDPPTIGELGQRLAQVDWHARVELPENEATDLAAFYHEETLGELLALRHWLRTRESSGRLDRVDRFVRLVAVNRLTGHSPGFFSVYTMPPNQAVSPAAQRKINAARAQTPPRRDVAALIARKARSLLRDVGDETRTTLATLSAEARLLTGDSTRGIPLPDASVDLAVTSPPFLDVVQYAADNWLRCWFCGIDADAVDITMARSLPMWSAAMTAALRHVRRVLRPGGHVAFEVGEVRRGSVRLDETVLDCAADAGLTPVCVVIQDQRFTKTANCWGVSNHLRGTNTQRIVVLHRPPTPCRPPGTAGAGGP